MPPHTRSQRRRPAARPQNRPAALDQVPTLPPSIGATVPLETPAARPARANRRVLSRNNPEPVDYTADYAAARTDLRWIALWSILLFVVMIALRFSGLV